MPFNGILLDKDGVLVDFARTSNAALSHTMLALAGGDAELHQRLASAMPGPWPPGPSQPAPLVAKTPESLAPAWAEALGRRDVDVLRQEVEILYRSACEARPTAIGQPHRLLSHLARAGLRIGVGCNDLERTVLRQAAQLGFLDSLDFIAGRDSGYGRKPSPGMIVAFAARFGLAPERVAVVGDELHDLQAAQAAGAVAIAVLTGSRVQDLSPYADYMIESIADLPALIDQLQAAAA